MKRSDLLRLLGLRGKKVLVLTHAGADVDAFASAASLSLSLGKNSKIGVPDHLNLNAKALAKNTSTNYSINPKISDFDAIIAVDFNGYEMLGSMKSEIKNFKNPIYVIDHHEKSKNPLNFKKDSILDKNAVSTTEIIYRIFKGQKITIHKETAIFIACGIITDSAHFLAADSEVFRIMAEMLDKSKMSFSEIAEIYKVKEDVGGKIAKLKAAKRARIYKISDIIVATTNIGSFEADAATALIRLGADIAFAGDFEKGALKISGRANNNFVKKSGFDLAKDIFMPLGVYFKGEGGGHPAAAAFNGTSEDFEEPISKCLLLTQKFFLKKNKSAEIKEYD